VLVIVALAGAALLAGLAVFQVLLIAGAPLGRFAWGGRTTVLPTGLRIGSAVAITLYAVFALVVLQSGGVSRVLPGGLVGVAIWVLTAYFAVGVAVNAASRSRPERLVMTPVALALAAVCLVLALN
jgi:hypothetical protein